MATPIADRLAALPPGRSVLDAFTADEYTAAISTSIQDGELANAIATLEAMAPRHPREAELLYQTLRVGIAAAGGA